MTPTGLKIWGSPAGQDLMRSMLAGKPLQPQQQETVQQLKRSGPPTAPSSEQVKTPA